MLFEELNRLSLFSSHLPLDVLVPHESAFALDRELLVLECDLLLEVRFYRLIHFVEVTLVLDRHLGGALDHALAVAISLK